MGKDITEQESPTEPRGRSRLWFHKDVKHVLTNNKGTNKITGIMLNFPKKSYEIFLDVGRRFSKMKNVKILMNYNQLIVPYVTCQKMDLGLCVFEQAPSWLSDYLVDDLLGIVHSRLFCLD
ncbi:unnamed protein product [Prunus armeniaca]|uniref:Uncharacterized protein n=1 Tax=Prunus armeniaca TaxID=36596 RepID=A0A6J5WIV4_PRUAR|nr:unnamed protein product [Prunus armeniaca]